MEKNINHTYHELLQEIVDDGYEYIDKSRNVTCRQIPSKELIIDLKQGLPVLTTKKVAIKTAIHETVWFFSGNTNIKYLIDNNVKIWNKDAYNYYLKNYKLSNMQHNKLTYEEFIDAIKTNKNNLFINGVTNYKLGDVGRMYGEQLRKWNGKTDQLLDLINNLRNNVYNRGNLISYWNPTDIPNQTLRCCHWSWEIVPDKNDSFNLIWNQRSTDTFLGLGINIFSYSLFAHIISLFIGKKPNKLIGRLSNVHLYENQIESAKKQLQNNPNKYKLPEIKFSDEYLDKFKENIKLETSEDLNKLLPSFNDITVVGYESYPPIKVEMLAPIM